MQTIPHRCLNTSRAAYLPNCLLHEWFCDSRRMRDQWNKSSQLEGRSWELDVMHLRPSCRFSTYGSKVAYSTIVAEREISVEQISNYFLWLKKNNQTSLVPFSFSSYLKAVILLLKPAAKKLVALEVRSADWTQTSKGPSEGILRHQNRVYSDISDTPIHSSKDSLPCLQREVCHFNCRSEHQLCVPLLQCLRGELKSVRPLRVYYRLFHLQLPPRRYHCPSLCSPSSSLFVKSR